MRKGDMTTAPLSGEDRGQGRPGLCKRGGGPARGASLSCLLPPNQHGKPWLVLCRCQCLTSCRRHGGEGSRAGHGRPRLRSRPPCRALARLRMIGKENRSNTVYYCSSINLHEARRSQTGSRGLGEEGSRGRHSAEQEKESSARNGPEKEGWEAGGEEAASRGVAGRAGEGRKVFPARSLFNVQPRRRGGKKHIPPPPPGLPQLSRRESFPSAYAAPEEAASHSLAHRSFLDVELTPSTPRSGP